MPLPSVVFSEMSQAGRIGFQSSLPFCGGLGTVYLVAPPVKSSPTGVRGDRLSLEHAFGSNYVIPITQAGLEETTSGMAYRVTSSLFGMDASYIDAIVAVICQYEILKRRILKEPAVPSSAFFAPIETAKGRHASIAFAVTAIDASHGDKCRQTGEGSPCEIAVQGTVAALNVLSALGCAGAILPANVRRPDNEANLMEEAGIIGAALARFWRGGEVAIRDVCIFMKGARDASACGVYLERLRSHAGS